LFSWLLVLFQSYATKQGGYAMALLKPSQQKHKKALWIAIFKLLYQNQAYMPFFLNWFNASSCPSSTLRHANL
jgi:hypothetical protein